MDTDTLVDDQIDDGQRIIEELRQRGVEVAAAFWLKPTEEGKWYFYLVSPAVDKEGIAKAYRQLHPLVRAVPRPSWIDPLKIKLIGPSHPIAQEVMAIHNRSSGPSVSPIRWGGITLGSMSVDGAYLYPLPATTV